MNLLQIPAAAVADAPESPPALPERRRRGRSLSVAQRIVVAAAALPLVGIVATTFAGAVGLISVDLMIEISLVLGEEPGMAVFAAMLWCSPIQRLVNRTQLAVRKMLGILFSGYAVSNLVMFGIERGFGNALSRPFLIAGTVAVGAAIPLLLTSGRWAQRKMGMRSWRNLHKLTYLIAVALVLHLALAGEFSFFALLILVAFVVRIPAVEKVMRSWVESLTGSNTERAEAGRAPGRH